MNSVIEIIETESYNTEIAKVIFGDFRLNAEYYAHDNNFALRDTLKTEKLSELADVLWFGPFKRYWIKNPQYGISLVSSSEMMELEPSCDKYISKKSTRDFEKYVVSKNTILVSCSGTIGNVTLVDSRLDGKALSQDSLRVIPKEHKYIGLLYTFLSSEYGRFLTSGKQSGAVIKHIYEEDLNVIEIPLVSMDTLNRLNEFSLKTFKKRDLANQLLTQARQLVLKYNNLPTLDEVQPETLDPEKETDLRLVSNEEFISNFRLDAHFYNPMAELAVGNIISKARDYCQLSELVNEIILGKRFKRNYVDSDHGTPFLSGKNIIQIRPEVKYLSNTEIKFMDDLLIKKNWTLITCSGTIGRTCFVYNNYEDFAASQHILRVNPDEKLIDPAYLYCFLSAEYGFHQIVRYRYGAVIDEIDDNNLAELLIPIINKDQQKEIGDLVRQAYDLRAEAIRLEDEAQEILTEALTGK